MVDGGGGSRSGLDVDHLSPGEPAVPACRFESDPERAEYQAGLDDGVTGASQPAEECPADGGVEGTDLGGVEQLESAPTGIGPGGRLGQEGQLALVPGDGHGPVGAEPDGRRVGGQLLPQFPGPDGELQLGTGGSATDPDEAEVPDRGPARSGIGLQVDDTPSPPAGLEGVHGAEDATTDDDHPARVHGPIVARERTSAGWRRPGRVWVPGHGLRVRTESGRGPAGARDRTRRSAVTGQAQVG